jgi:hypothetical protein
LRNSRKIARFHKPYNPAHASPTLRNHECMIFANSSSI